MTACCYPQSSVLDPLDLVDGRVADVWDPYSSSVVHHWLDIGLVGAQHRLLLAAPASAGQSAKGPEFSAAGFDDFCGMRYEGEVGVKIDSQDVRVLIERDWLTSNQNLGVGLGFSCFVGGEESDATLLRCDTQHLGLCPGYNCIHVSLEASLQICNFHS